jgi:hypothetical protein
LPEGAIAGKRTSKPMKGLQQIADERQNFGHGLISAQKPGIIHEYMNIYSYIMMNPCILGKY